jgi:carnitine 3-dehydrogenase
VGGPTLLFHLGAGQGGLAAFCERYSDSFYRWWDDLGQPHLDPATSGRLVDGLGSISDAHTVDDLSTRRDAVLTAVVAATHGPGALDDPRAGAHPHASG